MDLHTIGYCAARGQAVDLDNLRVPEHLVEQVFAEYEGALIRIFDAATVSNDKCSEAANYLVARAHALIAVCLLAEQDIDLLDEAVRIASWNRDSLRVLDPRHWRREDLISALRASGATEFRGRWAPLVDVC